MSEEIANERLSIRSSAKYSSLKRYGSTSSHVPPPPAAQLVNLVRHTVQAGDTLQGIALRYGVTMEQIRRSNRLWASDSLFLREHLMIPAAATDGDPSNPPPEEQQLNLSRAASVDVDEASIDEFLGKIDSSIAVTRGEVERCQGNSDFLAVDRDRRKPAVSRLRQSQANNNVVVVSNTRHVRTSLQKMERQQDELFQL